MNGDGNTPEVTETSPAGEESTAESAAENAIESIAEPATASAEINDFDDRMAEYVEELGLFFSEHPEVAENGFPGEVIEAFISGVPIRHAYDAFEKGKRIKELESTVTELTNKLNAASSASGVSGHGSVRTNELYSEEELNTLSSKELRKNLDKALKSMSEISKKYKI